MDPNFIPEFAIVGHPNEGKSSVVSTLAEDDSVRISPTPRETLVCRTFPVIIDGREIIRFTDTPGFQNPGRILQWMKNFQGDDDRIVEVFRKNHLADPEFKDDCELFKPVEKGAGIIFVVDGSRPVRKVDKAEMEVLRLTGRPRMAIINLKEDGTGHLDQWRSEFRKHFNSIRIFNAHRATYGERIALMESLKNIDQEWQPLLETVITAFIRDWEYRNTRTSEIISSMLRECLEFSISKNFTEKSNEETMKKQLQQEYQLAIEQIETNTHLKIRKLYKHNIFNCSFPVQSILHEHLFSEKTWQFLGLTKTQIIAAAGVGGTAIGAALDVAAHGLTFGVFSAIGGITGAGWAALGGVERLAKAKVVGMNLGGVQLRIGANSDIQFMYVMLDRALIYYSNIINWAHGRRNYPAKSIVKQYTSNKTGFSTEWDYNSRKVCDEFYKSINTGDETGRDASLREMISFLRGVLHKVSISERKYGLVFKD